MGHHRTISAATLNLRARASFPAAAPLAPAITQGAVARQQAPLPCWYGPLTLGGRADCFYRTLVAPKWCRYGWWSEDGAELTVTRIL